MMDEIIFWQSLWTPLFGDPQPSSAAKTIDVRINAEAEANASTIFNGAAISLELLTDNYEIFGGNANSSPAQEFSLGSAITGRYVQLSITDNWGGPTVTLGEVRLVSAIPEPATVCLLGLGGLSLIRRKPKA